MLNSCSDGFLKVDFEGSYRDFWVWMKYFRLGRVMDFFSKSNQSEIGNPVKLGQHVREAGSRLQNISLSVLLCTN